MSRKSKKEYPNQSKSSPIEPLVPVSPYQVRVIDQNCVHKTLLGSFFQGEMRI